MRKTIFTEQELTDKGFELRVDGGVGYFEYVFDKDNYWESKYLATTDDNQNENYQVINSINPDNGEPYLTEEEIDHLIKTGL